MPEVTSLLEAAGRGDRHAAAELLPLVYEELRRLAAVKLAGERPGQTLDATALVHEAYVRLVPDRPAAWDGRGHFFAAAAEAMRRILVDRARAKATEKRGGARERVPFDPESFAAPERADDLIDLDAALSELARTEPAVAKLVELRYFVGLTIPQAAEVLGVSTRTANAWWTYARAWLLARLQGQA